MMFQLYVVSPIEKPGERWDGCRSVRDLWVDYRGRVLVCKMNVCVGFGWNLWERRWLIFLAA